MKVLYTIATRERQTVGHGMSCDVEFIKRERDGEYPPVYSTMELALKYLDNLEFASDKRVIKLKLIK